ncbi:Spermatogenesis-associated protein 7 like protein [Trachymyrmex zeteki]|uniref:Spermatogenesis-associated protein 7 like protein n=1 Tax=Mycetomoellerius zeteki TaxID=64791 RepID=A0A151WR30_9HYME|nr:Spermatogenesis-associated protein 7 like protein [Trachymyrmex zeteki]
MTRCMKKQVNLKSSTYNQTGQNYFEQLAAYNSMSLHLRRILLARSVVDTRNKISLKRNQRYKVQRADDSEVCLRLGATDDVIDRLAYDTRHHPMDMLEIYLNAKHLDFCNCNLDQLKACSSHTYYDETDQMNRRQRSTSKSQRMTSPTTCSPKRKKFLVSNYICKKELNSMRDVPDINSPTCFLRQRRCRYEKEFPAPCAASRLDSTIFKSRSQSPRQPKIDYHTISSSVSQCYDFDGDRKCTKESKFISQKEEEKKYIKFVYDITKEIMQRGLYTDKELQDVFKKHINQYKGILNMNKMLYEIYQLKISLNIADDSDIDEELEDLIHAQKLLSVSEIRPPTPPKVLDENKVMAKLESYQKMMKADRSPKITTKSVMLVDANPELLITERDVLVSLVEAGVDPKQVQHICKNLRHKSRDISLIERVR